MYDLNDNGFLSKEELFVWLRDSLGDFGKGAEGDDDIRVLFGINKRTYFKLINSGSCGSDFPPV